jgi:hypothetical protein
MLLRKLATLSQRGEQMVRSSDFLAVESDLYYVVLSSPSKDFIV